jgi:hypothetical protein
MVAVDSPTAGAAVYQQLCVNVAGCARQLLHWCHDVTISNMLIAAAVWIEMLPCVSACMRACVQQGLGGALYGLLGFSGSMGLVCAERVL